MSGAAELRALAKRVLTEAPNYGLELAIRNAIAPDGPTIARPYTTRHDGAFGVMPDGFDWILARGKIRPDEPMFGMQVFRKGDRDTAIVEIESDDMCRLVTAAGLLSRAVDAEQKGPNA